MLPPPRDPDRRPVDPTTRPDLRPAATRDAALVPLPDPPPPPRHRRRLRDYPVASLDDLLADRDRDRDLDGLDAGPGEPPIHYDGVAPLVAFVVLVTLLLVFVLFVLPYLLV